MPNGCERIVSVRKIEIQRKKKLAINPILLRSLILIINTIVSSKSIQFNINDENMFSLESIRKTDAFPRHNHKKNNNMTKVMLLLINSSFFLKIITISNVDLQSAREPFKNVCLFIIMRGLYVSQKDRHHRHKCEVNNNVIILLLSCLLIKYYFSHFFFL